MSSEDHRPVTQVREKREAKAEGAGFDAGQFFEEDFGGACAVPHRSDFADVGRDAGSEGDGGEAWVVWSGQGCGCYIFSF